MKLCWLTALWLTLAGATASAETLRLRGETMGTTWQVSVAAAPSPAMLTRAGELTVDVQSDLDRLALADEDTAREALRTGSTSAVYLFDPAGTADRLLVASGGGTAVSGAVQQVFTKVTAAQQRTVAVDGHRHQSRVEQARAIRHGERCGATAFHQIPEQFVAAPAGRRDQRRDCQVHRAEQRSAGQRRTEFLDGDRLVHQGAAVVEEQCPRGRKARHRGRMQGRHGPILRASRGVSAPRRCGTLSR